MIKALFVTTLLALIIQFDPLSLGSGIDLNI